RRTGVLQANAGRGLIEHDQLIGLRKRQRLEQYAFDDAEDRRVRTDADRQGEDRDRREPRQLKQSADDVSETHPSLGRIPPPNVPTRRGPECRTDRPIGFRGEGGGSRRSVLPNPPLGADRPYTPPRPPTRPPSPPRSDEEQLVLPLARP